MGRLSNHVTTANRSSRYLRVDDCDLGPGELAAVSGGKAISSTPPQSGQSPAGFVCQLQPAETALPAATVAADLQAQLGVQATAEGSTLTVNAPSGQLAWAAGQWAVARAEAYGVNRVQVGDRAWSRGTGGSAESWSTGESAPTPTTVTIQLAASRP